MYKKKTKQAGVVETEVTAPRQLCGNYSSIPGKCNMKVVVKLWRHLLNM